jgi:antitoxin (DNA-binding transcriptional repressor) of toxin-antitoxin stability system
MYETRSVTEVARHFADYINRVVYRGERFVLMRGNRPVAELGPLPAEAEAFADDLISARSMLAATDVRDPWAS